MSTDVLCARLRVLAQAVADGRVGSEFSMRVPAEPDRDADIVLSRAAKAIEDLTAERDALRALALRNVLHKGLCSYFDDGKSCSCGALDAAIDAARSAK